MLIMFRANNFTSFKDDVVMDLRKTSYKQHHNHIFRCGNFELLKTVAIFGANASGKSNLVSAIANFKNFMMKQFLDNQLDEESIDIQNKKNSMQPFLLSNKGNNKIEFEIVFSHKDTIFQYGYSVEEKKICSEWLLIDDEEVFDRTSETEISFGHRYYDILKSYTKVREDRLYLSLLDYFAAEKEIKEKLDLFKEYFINKFNIYFELIFESSIKGTGGVIALKKEFFEDEGFRKRVSHYVRKIDVGIKELIVDEETIKNRRTGEEETRSVPKAIHDIYDESGNVIGEKAFTLNEESSGTLRFISFIQEILKIIEGGGVFIVDELSSRLHPLLTKFIIDMFQSEFNEQNAQLIFTTHDISIMNKEQFRRDEVAFVDKDKTGASTLYTLADLGVREDARFGKDYFRGKYGAIPIIKDWIEEE